MAGRITVGIDTAVRTVERMANAFADLDGFGADRVALTAALELVPETLAEARRQIVWTQRDPQGRQRHGAMLRRPDGSVLEDDIDPVEGTHLLGLRSAERGHAMLAAILDVRPDAADEGTHPDAGQPHPGGEGALADQPLFTCRLSTGPVWASDLPERRITTFGTADSQLWLLDDATDRGPVRADAPSLRRVAEELLEHA